MDQSTVLLICALACAVGATISAIETLWTWYNRLR
jgi:hypothetical protein